MSERERAFTVVEVLFAAAIASFVIFGLVAIAARTSASAALLNDRLVAQRAASRLSERLASESGAAWAVFVPPTDVLGAGNADGHEVDFIAEDATRAPYAWAYRFDAAAKTLTRYAYAPGEAAQAGEVVGKFDAFAATMHDASDVAAPANPLYDPLFANATVQNVRYDLGILAGADGGNGVIDIAFRAHGVAERVAVASGTAPTSFTIVLPYTPPPSTATPTPGPLPTLTPTPP